MALTHFDPPGFCTDLDESGRAAWSDSISKQLDDVRASDGAPDLKNAGPRLQFFNMLKDPPAADAVTKDISWTAFPRQVKVNYSSDREAWRAADESRDVQDEYCEWSVTRDSQSGKITRVTFTSEGPEYWEFLAARAPETLLALYKEHVNTNVRKEDLFASDETYLERNDWNNSTSRGAMHLIQGSNNLAAEIELAAAATIVRLENGLPITDSGRLIKCSLYGEPARNSDPHIGSLVNELARAKHDVTLANPVGLYIAGLTTSGWATPDGSSASDYWKITRGDSNYGLRAVYEVPAGKNFVVADIKINGEPIEFGGQIADFIKIKLTGLATRLGKSQVQPFDTCASRTSAAKVAMFAHSETIRSRR